MENFRKTQTGVVISNKMKKTVVVEISRRVQHALFGKFFLKRKKFKAHDEKNEAQVGDTVLIQECAPISRDKRWTIAKIVEKAPQY